MKKQLFFVFLLYKKMAKTAMTKGQIISKCPYEIIVYPKIATKKFLRSLRKGQIKKNKGTLLY